MNVVKFQVVRQLVIKIGNEVSNINCKICCLPDQLLTQMFGQNRYLVQTEKENEQRTVVVLQQVLESLMKQTRFPNQAYLTC